MRHRQHDTVVSTGLGRGDQLQPVFIARLVRISPEVVRTHRIPFHTRSALSPPFPAGAGRRECVDVSQKVAPVTMSETQLDRLHKLVR